MGYVPSVKAFLVTLLVSVLMLGCGTKGDTGPTGPTGPAMPVIHSLSATGLPASPGGSVSIQVSAQSPEGLSLSYVWSVSPSGWTISSGQGTETIDITAPTTYGVTGSAQVSVTDSEGRSGVGLISLSTEGNSAPIIHSLSANPNPVVKGGTVSLEAFASDPNGDSLSYTWVVPAGFSIVSGQGTSTLSIQSTAFASGAVSLSADDGSGGNSTAAIGISVYDGTWGYATQIEAGSWDAQEPKVVIDQSENATVVWHQWDGAQFSIYSNRYSPISGWSTPVLIESDNTSFAQYPQADVDPSGNVFSAWHQSDGTRVNIWANRYTSGVGWGTAVLIETDNTGDALSPQLAVDSSGNAIVVWYQWDGLRYNIWSNRYTSGTGWGTASLIETDNAGDAWYPHVDFDPSGNAFAVWYQSDGSRNNIWSNQFTVGTGWGTAQLIESDNTGDANYPRVVTDSAGNAIAFWHQLDGSRYNIMSNRYSPGSGWGTAVLLETNNAGDAMWTRAGVDQSGNVICVWGQSDGTRYSIWSNRYESGTGWGTATLVEIDDTGGASSPDVVVDQTGNAVAVWYQWDGARLNAWANRFRLGSGWGRPELLEYENLGDAGKPSVAVSPSGSVIAVWHQFDGTRDNVLANIFE